MNYLFRIYRYDPKKDKEPYYMDYRLEVEATERILDCLNRIRWEMDPTLSFRMSCAHGVCGSDGMKINGICGLACQKLVKDYSDGTITVDPLPNFPVVKDLIVDLESFFEKYRSVKPYLMTDEKEPEFERLQTIEERKIFDEAIRCILCACCSASCPVTETSEDFAGPAPLLRSFRYLFDSRDKADKERIAMLDTPDGAHGCKAHGKCTEVCPKEIQVAKAIGKTKKKIYDLKKQKKS